MVPVLIEDKQEVGNVVLVISVWEQHVNSVKLTLFVTVEQDALSFKDKDDVFWVGTIQDFGRLCTKELIGLVDFLKHVLKDPQQIHMSGCVILMDSSNVPVRILKPTLPSGFLSG